MQVTQKTVLALRGAIVKWTKIVQAIESDEKYEENGFKDCPLCQLFHPLLNGRSRNDTCGACPIAEDTGFDKCAATPMKDWDYDETEDNAVAMLAYLENLRAKCEVIRDPADSPESNKSQLTY